MIVHVSAGLRPVCDSRGPRPAGRPVPAPQTGARGPQCGERGARGLGPVSTAWVPHTHTDVACLTRTRTQPRAGARGPGSAWHPSPGCRFHLLPPPRRRRLEAAAHVGGCPAASRPRPPSGPCHSSIQIATPLPHTARSPPGSRLVSHHGPDPRALRFGCWSPELWPRGETPPVLTPLCIRPPRGHTRPRTRKLCVERLGPRITPRRRAAPSQDLAWVRNDCPRGRALTGRWGWRSALTNTRTRQTS